MFYKNTDNCRVLLIKTADNEDAGEGQTVEENELHYKGCQGVREKKSPIKWPVYTFE